MENVESGVALVDLDLFSLTNYYQINLFNDIECGSF